MSTEAGISLENLAEYHRSGPEPEPWRVQQLACRPLIVGHFGGCNTGDEAMLEGFLEALGPEARRSVSVVVKKENGAEGSLRRIGVEPVPAGFRAVLRALLRTDSLVLCGGTHFHDDYHTLRYLRHVRYMARYVSLSMLSKLMRKRVTWLGMGFGPFYRRPTRWLTRLGLRFCDRVSVRDLRSLEEIAAWIPREKLDLTFDLAGLLARNLRSCKVRPSAKPFRCSILGISATSVRQNKSGGRRADETFWRKLAGALNATMEENKDLRVRVIVLRGGSRENDKSVSVYLHDAISSVHAGRSELIPYDPDPNTTWRKIAECNAFVATRFHAGVLAYLAECRLLFLAYHRKVRDLAREIGLAEEACLGISENVDEEELAQRLRALTSGDETFRPRLPVLDATRRASLNIRTLQKSI